VAHIRLDILLLHTWLLIVARHLHEQTSQAMHKQTAGNGESTLVLEAGSQMAPDQNQVQHKLIT